MRTGGTPYPTYGIRIRPPAQSDLGSRIFNTKGEQLGTATRRPPWRSRGIPDFQRVHGVLRQSPLVGLSRVLCGFFDRASENSHELVRGRIVGCRDSRGTLACQDSLIYCDAFHCNRG
jgi:hypothetical protein